MLQERENPAEGYLFVSTTKGKGDKLEVRTINQAMKVLAEKTFGVEKAKEFKTKALRSFYNSALLRADIKSEVKDLMIVEIETRHRVVRARLVGFFLNA